MPLFRYKAVAESGEVVISEIDAVDQATAVGLLRELGQLPIRVRPVRPNAWRQALNADLFSKQMISSQDVAVLTRELATLLGAGLPIDRALELLAELADRPALRKLSRDILGRVRGGDTLADSLAAQGKAFPKFHVSMVRAGEAGASLETVLGNLADHTEKAVAMRNRVKSALVYPMILSTMAIVSIVVLLGYVIPSFEPLFEGTNVALPLATRIVLGLGDAFAEFGWLGTIAIAALVIVLRVQLSRPESRLWWHRFSLRIPLAGDLIAKIETARFSRTLATLLRNGVTLLNALALVRDVVGNAALAQTLGTASDQVKGGRGLAEPLAQMELLPKMAVQLIHVGEESGHLEDMLFKVADIYDRNVEHTVQRLLALLVPLLTLGLGALVAFIISSILLALFSINELVI